MKQKILIQRSFLRPEKVITLFAKYSQFKMDQSQLIELIRTISASDKELVLEFAGLSFFNNGRMKVHVPRLLDICMNHPWNDPTQVLDKRSLFLSLFPLEEFVEGRIDKLMVEAHKIIRNVLLLKHYFREDNEFQQRFNYSEILLKKGLNDRYKHMLTQLQKLQEVAVFKDEKYFNQQVIVENAIHESKCYNNQKKGDLNVPNLLGALEIKYQLSRLSVLNRFLIQQKFSNIEVSEVIKCQIQEDQLPSRLLEVSPVLDASHAIFKLLIKNQPEFSDIQSLFDLLRYHEKNLDPENLQEFYTYLRNLCIQVLSADMEQVNVEYMLHNLYKDNLKRGYLHYEGKFHPSRYWAVSSNAIRVKDFDWAIAFIETYKHELIGENETYDIYRLNLANYLFGMGRFAECLDNIPASSPFVDYFLRGKCLEIKAYYELKSDLLSFKLEAFKVFLSRTSPKLLSETQKQIHVDFANLLTQISTSIKGDQKRADRVISRIQGKKQSAEWRWLLEKAKALKEKP